MAEFTHALIHGRRLRGRWGNGPPKIWGGGRPMHPSSQYLEKLFCGMRGKAWSD